MAVEEATAKQTSAGKFQVVRSSILYRAKAVSVSIRSVADNSSARNGTMLGFYLELKNRCRVSIWYVNVGLFGAIPVM